MKKTLLSWLAVLAISIQPIAAQQQKAALGSISVQMDSVQEQKGLRFDFAKAVFQRAGAAGYALPGPARLIVLAIALPFAAIAGVLDLFASIVRHSTRCSGKVVATLTADGLPVKAENVWIGVPDLDSVDEKSWLIQQPYMVKTDDSGHFSLPFELRFGSMSQKVLEVRSLGGYPVRDFVFKIDNGAIAFTDVEPYSNWRGVNPNQRIWPK